MRTALRSVPLVELGSTADVPREVGGVEDGNCVSPKYACAIRSDLNLDREGFGLGSASMGSGTSCSSVSN
jgi:hypothetical protein